MMSYLSSYFPLILIAAFALVFITGMFGRVKKGQVGLKFVGGRFKKVVGPGIYLHNSNDEPFFKVVVYQKDAILDGQVTAIKEDKEAGNTYILETPAGTKKARSLFRQHQIGAKVLAGINSDQELYLIFQEK